MAATAYAQEIPVRVIAKMLGWPLEDAPIFREFVHDVIESIDLPMEQRFENFLKLEAYLRAQVEDHLANPRDDLTTYLLEAEMGGEPLNEDHIGGTIILLLLAGIDTTWSAIGASLWHLAATPADRERLVNEPELMPFAIEELLRFYAPVTMARLVKDDFEFNGCPMKADEWVLLPFPAANRDPDRYQDPDRFDITRTGTQHLSFAAGIHYCLGAPLARLEGEVVFERLLARFPTIDADTTPVWRPSLTLRGLETLQVTVR